MFKLTLRKTKDKDDILLVNSFEKLANKLFQ